MYLFAHYTTSTIEVLVSNHISIFFLNTLVALAKEAMIALHHHD